jgi:hypothetical protein
MAKRNPPKRFDIKPKYGVDSPFGELRSQRADRFRPGWRRTMREYLDAYVKQVASAAGRGMPFPDDLTATLERRLFDPTRRWSYRVAQDGYETATAELIFISGAGKSDDEYGGKADVVVGGVDMSTLAGAKDPYNDFTLHGDFPTIDAWAQTTAYSTSQTKSKRLAEIWRDAENSRDPKTGAAWTPAQISKAIRERGLTENVWYSDMLARTGTIWSMNEGTVQRYRNAGVQAMEWVAGFDDVTCPFCAQLHNEVVRIDEPFWLADADMGAVLPNGRTGVLKIRDDVGHPPLHPNCRCTIVPVMKTVSVPISKPKLPKKKRKPKKKLAPVAKVGSEQHETWVSTLTTEEIRLLRKWVDDERFVARIRKAQAGIAKQPSRATINAARDIEAILANAPRQPGKSYRGLSDLSEKDYALMKRGKNVTFRSTSSLTADRTVAEDFAETYAGRSVIFEIDQQTAVGIYDRSIARELTFERELLARRGTRYRVTGRKEIVPKGREGRRLIIKLKEIV